MITSSWFFEEVVRHSDGGTPPTSRYFVGRQDELDRLGAFLEDDARAVVITAIAGTAGIGKTTLATRWANTVRHQFPDGQLHVDLRGFDSRAQLDPAQVLHGFLEALGVVASAIPGDPDARSALYRSLMADRRMLIVLDNARSADQVRPLLPNLLRIYARERAEHDEPDLEAVKARVVDYYVDVVTVADCHIQPCRDGEVRQAPSPACPPHLTGYRDAMAWLARENATVLAVVDFAARNGLARQVGRLAWAFTTFLTRSGQRHERVAIHRAALAAAPDDHARFIALPFLARALARLERFVEAEKLLDEATELAARLADSDCILAVHLAYVRLARRYRWPNEHSPSTGTSATSRARHSSTGGMARGGRDT